MGLFDTMRNAKATVQADYIPHPGDFCFKVLTTKYQPNRSKIHSLIWELETIESNHEKCKVGDVMSYYLGEDSDYFNSDAVAFQIALFGLSPLQTEAIARLTQEIPARLETAVDPAKNAYQGMYIRCSTKGKITKENKRDITIHHWRPYYNTPAEAEAVYAGNLKGGAPAAGPKPPPPPPPPPPGADPRASWQKSPDGFWLLDPSKNDWVKA